MPIGWLVGEPWLGSQGVNPSFPNVDLQTWLGSDGIRTDLEGLVTLSPLRQVVEPATYYANWLALPGNWDASRTDGVTPVIKVETRFRRVSFDKRDVVTVRYDLGAPEPADIGYDFEHDVETLTLMAFTRRGQVHAQLLYEEAKRLLLSIRRDPYGVHRGGGRDWLKLTQLVPAQKVNRATWKMEATFEITVRWRPIDEPWTSSAST